MKIFAIYSPLGRTGPFAFSEEKLKDLKISIGLLFVLFCSVLTGADEASCLVITA